MDKPRARIAITPPPKPTQRTKQVPPLKPVKREVGAVPPAKNTIPNGSTGRCVSQQEDAALRINTENFGDKSEAELKVIGAQNDAADEYKEAIENWGDNDPRTIAKKKAFETAKADANRFFSAQEACPPADTRAAEPAPAAKPASKNAPPEFQKTGAVPKCDAGDAQFCSYPGADSDADRQSSADRPVDCFGNAACIREEAQRNSVRAGVPAVVPEGQPPNGRIDVPGYPGSIPYGAAGQAVPGGRR